jgi:heme/copper-type cytochrome/quinol oxidase subunit 3
MLALPPAPAPAPQRQVLTATALGGAAATMLMGGMFAVWFRFRNAQPLVLAKEALIPAWLPKGVKVPMVPANILLTTMFVGCLMGQFAIYAAKRADRTNTAIGLGIMTVIGAAAINAQAVIYIRMAVSIHEGAYGPMFYAVTGTFVVLTMIAIVFAVLALFRFLGGRSSGHEMVSAAALYWYILTGIYCALWFVVYVTK